MHNSAGHFAGRTRAHLIWFNVSVCLLSLLLEPSRLRVNVPFQPCRCALNSVFVFALHVVLSSRFLSCHACKCPLVASAPSTSYLTNLSTHTYTHTQVLVLRRRTREGGLRHDGTAGLADTTRQVGTGITTDQGLIFNPNKFLISKLSPASRCSAKAGRLLTGEETRHPPTARIVCIQRVRG